MSNKKVAIIGGGAAGFFGALQLKEKAPHLDVVIFEKTNKLLSKVKVSGGGRCNVTHACFNPRELVKNYPRGMNELKSVFSRFQPGDTIEWFANNGVELKTEEDGRMFPVTDSSQTIIDCFINKANQLGVEIKKQKELKSISKDSEQFRLEFNDEEFVCDAVLVATGGGNKRKFFDHVLDVGHEVNGPLPSLFTFNIHDEDLRELKGLSFQDIEVKVEGTKMNEVGDLLITHWGVSGPGVLKLSAYGAEWMAEKDYNFHVMINWSGWSQEYFRESLMQEKANQNKALVYNIVAEHLPLRLKKYLVEKSGVSDKKVIDLSKKDINRLVQNFCLCRYEVQGTTTFKEEFVTCGGVMLKEIDFRKMESKLIENLYLAGEVIDVDGITGGFNFQNAWSTSFIAANAIAEKLT